MAHKLGRQPRKFDKRIPKLSTVLKLAGKLAPAPLTIDESSKFPADLGMMGNDKLGDCTCAGWYHAVQWWTGIANPPMFTEPDANVIHLYSQFGYNPADPNSDQGAVEQDVLKYLLNTGYQYGFAGETRKIFGYVEVDQKNLDDLKRVIYEFGIAYVGINVPESVMDNANDTSILWDYLDNDPIAGGHCVILVGYDLDTFTCVSWGKQYKLTHNFLGNYLEEAYAIADPAWLEAPVAKEGEEQLSAKTPLGLTAEQLEALMGDLKEAA